MTVLDTSVVVDFLLDVGVANEVTPLLGASPPPVAPDIVVFEVMAVLRRSVLRGDLHGQRAANAVRALGDLSLEIFACLPLRTRAFALRDNLTAADALFVALAERLDEPLATKDASLASAARAHSEADVVLLGRSAPQ